MPARIDDLLTRRHRGAEYDCLDFAAEIWAAETGEDLSGRLGDLLTGATADRKVSAEHVRRFERLERPVSPCFVMMHARKSAPHVGVWLRGRVAHLTERGAEYIELAAARRGYPRVAFYR